MWAAPDRFTGAVGKVSVVVYPGQGDVCKQLMSGHFRLFSVIVLLWHLPVAFQQSLSPNLITFLLSHCWIV